jgi:hypothetical protein
MLTRIADYIEQYVQDTVESMVEEPLPCLLQDIISATLIEVDYRDIAEHYIDDVIANHHTVTDEDDSMYGEVA